MLNKLITNISDSEKKQFTIFFSILLCLSIIMIISYQPLCVGHDLHFHLRRLNALMEALNDGNFPYYLDYTAIDGYGYFTKAFYPDLMLVPFALIGNLTNIEFAYHTILFVSTILCGTFTYLSVKIVYKNNIAAAISSILYTFCMYRLLDIYHRAALGEALSFTFLPIVFMGMYYIIKGNYKKWYVLAIGYSLMIYTHLISTVLTGLFILIFLAIYNKSLRNEPIRIKYLFISGLSTILLTGSYIIPMLEQMHSNNFYFETQQIMSQAQDSAMEMHWILWGLFTGGVQAKQLFLPGIGLLLTMGIGLRVFVYEKSKELKSVDILVIIGALSIFAISSFFPWSFFPFNKLNFIQLPWRLFEFISYFFAIAGGYYFSKIVKGAKRTIIAGGILVAFTAFFIINDSSLYKELRSGVEINEKPKLENNYHLGGMEYVPAAVPSLKFLAERSDSIINNKGIIQNFEKQKGVTGFDIVTTKEENISLPLLFYKGYSATLNGEIIDLKENKYGLVEIHLNQSGHVEIKYSGTSIQKISTFVSIISILALFLYILKRKT